MPEERSDPLADLFTLVATPVSGTIRSIEQFRKGTDEFLRGVENFNRTMENLNQTAERINTLLAEVEEPLRAAIPQVTRTVKAADEMMQVVSGPAMAVAPGLNRLAETLSTPAFAQLPNQIGAFSDVLNEVSKRLGPLSVLAESAGGLFGGFRMPGSRPTAPPRPESAPAASEPTTTEKSAAGTSSAKKSTATKSSAKKSTAKKSTAKKGRATRASTTKQAAAAKPTATKKAAAPEATDR
jgi:hypothetical protein